MSFKEHITSHLRAGQQTELEGEERELFIKGRGAIARWAEQLPHPDHPDCTGLGASYCSIHGDCTCEDRGGAVDEDPKCPLHGEPWAYVEAPACEECETRLLGPSAQDMVDLSQIRFRRVLCKTCFDVARGKTVVRPDPTRKTF